MTMNRKQRKELRESMRLSIHKWNKSIAGKLHKKHKEMFGVEPVFFGATDKKSPDYLDKIRPVEFDWNEKAYEMGFKPDQHHEFGFIAQELGEVLPQSIAPAPINKKDDDYLTIKEEKLIPILVSSLKEQRNEIADLKEDIKDLKKIVKEL